MHFDGIMNTLEGRHLVFAYAVVLLIQGGYVLWIARRWFALNAQEKKSTKPVA